MFDPKFFDDVVERIGKLIPPELRTTQTDVKKNIHAVLEASFAKLNWVTREEFDTQSAVLQKTRSKLESLTEKIAQLEAQLLKK